MSKFKVGDKVKCISLGLNNECFGVIGNIYTVLNPELENRDMMIREANMSVSPDRFELVEENMTELEELVKKANEGYLAVNKILINYRNSVEYNDKNSKEYREVIWTAVYTQLRIKPKPKFEPFTVGQGWRVELNPTGGVNVGCQNFEVRILKDALYTVCKQNHTSSLHDLNGGKLEAGRTGVHFKGHKITWEEAEKLLTALEKVTS